MTTGLAVGLAEAVTDVLDRLHAAGLQAALSTQDLQAPGILLSSPSIEFRFGRCHSATFTAWALAPGLARDQALGQLARLLETASSVLTELGSPIAAADPDDMGPPTGGLLPAYAFTFTVRIH